MTRALMAEVFALLLVSAAAANVRAGVPAGSIGQGTSSADARPSRSGKTGEANLVKLNLVLPKPLFIGTPKNIRTPNLEPDRKGKLRPPFFVPPGTQLLSLKKPVLSSDMEPIIGEIPQVTDGDREGREGSYVELGPGRQYVQIDLKAVCRVACVLLWHYHGSPRVYRDVVVQVSEDDPDFILDARTIYNNDHDNSSGFGVGMDHEYIETFEGRLVGANGARARYVRLYTNGSTAGDMNHYVEVEVYGTPEK